jgi:hypothetical protein
MGVSVVLLCTLLAAATPAQPSPEGGSQGEPQPGESASASESDSPERLGGVNPARLIPRLELRQRFVRASEGGGLHSSTLRMDLVLFRRALLRYELPLVVRSTGSGSTSGIGDIRFSAFGLLDSGPRHAVVLVGGVILDSASVPQVGAGKSQATFGAAAGYKPIALWLTYGMVVQQLSFAGDPARAPISQLFLEWGNVLFGGGGVWYLLDLDVTHDFHASVTRFVPQLEAGHLLNGRVALFLRAGTPFFGPRQFDYFLDAGIRYLFRL